MVRKGSWLPCASLALSAFVFNTSEFIPVALLSDIAGDFSISEARVGMIISVYAWVVGVMSLPLMVAVARMDWRRLMMWLVGLFALFQCASALAPTYGMLMLSRVGVACCHSVFWGVVPPYAIATAPEGRSAGALGVVITGASVAMIVGTPLGRVVGLWLSWRVTFAIVSAVSLLVLACFVFVLPPMRSGSGFSVRNVPAMLGDRLVLLVYAFILVSVTAYFTLYSYIEPFLAQVAGLSPVLVTATLSVMGVAGVIAGWSFSRWYSRCPALFFSGAACLMACFLGLAFMLSAWAVAVMLVCFCGSMSLTWLNLANQEELITHGPQPSTITVATYSGVFNVGIGTGAFMGGLLVTHIGISWLGYCALPLMLVAVALSFRLSGIAGGQRGTDG